MTRHLSSSMRRGFARLAVAGGFAVALVASADTTVLAQQKSQKAAPKGGTAQAQQQQPQQPQQQQPGTSQPPPLIYSNWTKVCSKSQEAGGKTLCRIGKDGRLENGMPLVGVVIMEVEGEARKVVRFMLPVGILLPRGTRVIIDNDEQSALVLPIITCVDGACIAQTEANPDTIAKLKKGKNLFLQAYSMQQTVFSLPVPLSDFAKAYDGPSTDPKEIEARNKKLQEELMKRGRERAQPK